MATDTKIWLPYHQPNPSAKLRLICFPHAGGSASVFRRWSEFHDLEIMAIQWPGREARSSEQPFRRLHAMVDAAHQVLAPCLDQKPFAVFGHSLGAKIAYEFVRLVEEQRGALPLRLIVAGCGAVHLPDRGHQLHALSDPAFLEGIHRLGGTSPEILSSSELMKLLLPMLRSDYTASETYSWIEGPRLATPISALGGSFDPDVDERELNAWQELTNGDFQSTVIEGGHFFVTQSLRQVVETVQKACRLDSLVK